MRGVGGGEGQSLHEDRAEVSWPDGRELEEAVVSCLDVALDPVGSHIGC